MPLEGRSLLLVVAAILVRECTGAVSPSIKSAMHARNFHWSGIASPTNVSAYYYLDAQLDHYSDVATGAVAWKQRYSVDDTHWCGEGCPIFLGIGGESEAVPGEFAGLPLADTFIFTLAEQQGALIVILEHRFFGESVPTIDLATSNLRYLTTAQALADLARFTQYILRFNPAHADALSTPALALHANTATSKVVTFGYSYPGALSAWARLKYPSLFAGAVASSAPVYAENRAIQSAQVCGAALSHPPVGGSAACVTATADAISKLMALVKSTTPMGSSPEIPKGLRPCTAINNANELAQYETNVLTPFRIAAQNCFLGNATAWDGNPLGEIGPMCKALTNSSVPALDGLAAAARYPTRYDSNDCIWSEYDGSYLANTTVDTKSSGRQWWWLMCNELGWFNGYDTSGTDHPFVALTSVTLETWLKTCRDAYGLPDSYSGANTNWTNTYYGSRDLQVENIVLPNGNMDPWHAFGLMNSSDRFYESCAGKDGNQSEDGPCPQQAPSTTSRSVVFIEGEGHMRDSLRPGFYDTARFGSSPDSVYVQWAHAAIAAAVAGFIS
jgi:serine protease 16